MIDENLNKKEDKEIIEDLGIIYNHYINMLKKGKTSVSSLNTVIRALKAVHKYFSEDDSSEQKNIQDEI